jgi:hypothetical protein
VIPEGIVDVVVTTRSTAVAAISLSILPLKYVREPSEKISLKSTERALPANSSLLEGLPSIPISQEKKSVPIPFAIPPLPSAGFANRPELVISIEAACSFKGKHDITIQARTI